MINACLSSKPSLILMRTSSRSCPWCTTLTKPDPLRHIGVGAGEGDLSGYPIIRPWLPTRVSLATRHALAELLGKRDNDALRPADVG
jgi:hypothetical protein